MTPPARENFALPAVHERLPFLLTVSGGEDSAADPYFRNLDEKRLAASLPDEVAGLGSSTSGNCRFRFFEEYQRITEAQDFIVQGWPTTWPPPPA